MPAAPIDLQSVIDGDLAQAIARRRDSSDAYGDNARNGSLYDQRQLQGYITMKLYESDTPQEAMNGNLAVRTPYGMGPSGETVPSAAVATKQ